MRVFYYNLLVDMCVLLFFFLSLITGFGDEMEESGFVQKNLVEVILVQEEEERGGGGGEGKGGEKKKGSGTTAESQ